MDNLQSAINAAAGAPPALDALYRIQAQIQKEYRETPHADLAQVGRDHHQVGRMIEAMIVAVRAGQTSAEILLTRNKVDQASLRERCRAYFNFEDLTGPARLRFSWLNLKPAPAADPHREMLAWENSRMQETIEQVREQRDRLASSLQEFVGPYAATSFEELPGNQAYAARYVGEDGIGRYLTPLEYSRICRGLEALRAAGRLV